MLPITLRMVIAVCLFVLAARPGQAFEVRQCEPLELSDVLVAASFIDQNLTAMVDQMTFLTRQQQAEIIRKWPRLTLRCAERRGCKHAGVDGFAHGGLGNAVNICHATMVDIGATLCNLIKTIMHEQGHAHGFKAFRNHNDPINHPDVFDNDPMYRMGDIALTACSNAVSAGSFTNRPLQGTPRFAIGASCGRDTECQSSNCRRGICICVQDEDCGGGTGVCERVGENTCLPGGLASGAACKRDRQCVSKKCRRDSCT
jgi:hypothetical protein